MQCQARRSLVIGRYSLAVFEIEATAGDSTEQVELGMSIKYKHFEYRFNKRRTPAFHGHIEDPVEENIKMNKHCKSSSELACD